MFSRVPLFVTPQTAARQVSLSFTISQNLLKLMSIESVRPSKRLILCHLLLLLTSIFPSIRVSSKESVLHIRWPEYWSFSSSVSSFNECSGLISLRIDWFDLPAVEGNSQESSTAPQFKGINSLGCSLFHCPCFISVLDYWKNHSLTIWTFVGKVMSLHCNMLPRLIIAFFQEASVF